MKVIIAFVLLIGFSATSHAQSKFTGKDLKHECEAVGMTNRTAQQRVDAAHCLGFVAGMAYSVSTWEGFNKKKNLGLESVPACLPNDATSGEYVRVVLRYLDAHPSELHESFGTLVLVAFADAYPCPATK